MAKNNIVTGVAVIAGVYALWYYMKEDKKSKASATATMPAETPREILQKIVTTNPIPQAPLMLADIKSGAVMAYQKVSAAVKGFTDPILGSPSKEVVVTTTTTSTSPMGASVGANGKVMGFQDDATQMAMHPMADINNYCNCDKNAAKPLTVMSKLKL